jgi:putative ABC transport system permease protein
MVGLVPALKAGRGDLQTALSRGSRRVAGENNIARRALVIAEVSLALVLLVSAGLLLRSMRQLLSLNVGFDPSHLVTMQVVISPRRFDSDATRYQFFREALARVQQQPGVVSAAFTNQLPLSGDLDGYGVHFEKDRDASNDGAALRYAITPDYFATMRIPLLQGRLLGLQDVANAPRAALINESFATRVFPVKNALGRRLRLGPEEGDWYTIVGVVGDVTQGSLAGGAADAVYVSPQQWHWVDNAFSLVVRARGDESQLPNELKRAIWSVDHDQAIVRVATMDNLLAASESQRRFAMILFEAFAAVALALAAIGIYGLLSGTVAERVREIGVRTALGATRGEVVGLVVRQGLLLTSAGIVIGVGIALAATRALATLLFGISRLDVVTYFGVIALLGAVTVAACTLPAWRAARIDPSVTLRAE